jgi:hypothetical protein
VAEGGGEVRFADTIKGLRIERLDGEPMYAIKCEAGGHKYRALFGRRDGSARLTTKRLLLQFMRAVSALDTLLESDAGEEE